MISHTAQEALSDLLEDGVSTAIQATLDVAADAQANDADRLRAASMILRIAGLMDGDNRPDPDSVLAEASTAELRQQLQELRQERALSAAK